MHLHQLPSELLNAILSHLGVVKDYLSLRACALTCRTLVSPAQAYLFRAVLVESEATTVTVLKKLESTPHIATFVKRLHLVEIHKPWIQRSEVLRRLFGLLSSYTFSLHIHQRRRKSENSRLDFSLLSQLRCIEEISLSEGMQKGVLAGSLYDDNALPTFLNYFSTLRAITFDECLVQNQTIGEKTDVAAPVFQLERLDVRSCRDELVLGWLMPALSSLQILHISYPAPNTTVSRTTFPNFIIAAGEWLRHLEARDLCNAIEADLQPLMNAVRIHATNLRTLKLMITGTGFGHPPIQVVVQSLLLIGTHRQLQHLTVGIFQDDALLEGNPWNELQDVLLGTRFSALQSVEIRLLLLSPDSILVSPEPVIAAIPRLSQKKRILVYPTLEYT